MFPSLHDDVVNALTSESTFLSPEPWFNVDDTNPDLMTVYSTNIMGRFTCPNRACAQKGWGSKKIAILIRQFPGNGYNAEVFKQRCKSCNRLGALRMDENSYVERVAYRLKKWAGVVMETPEYNGGNGGPEHEYELCEGCKRGYCQRG